MSKAQLGLAAMVLTLAVSFALLLFSPATAGSDALGDKCLLCHSGQVKGAPIVQMQLFKDSVHASFSCTSCHRDVTKIPHPTKLQPVDPKSCGLCHIQVAKTYESSVHGQALAQGMSGVANCSNCHGTHDILAKEDPKSPVYPFNLPQTCGRCHGNQQLAEQHNIPVPQAYQSYMQSVHGAGLTKLGLLFSATCNDCHGAHDIQPAQDPRSTINRRNLSDTCGRCHVGILAEYKQSVHGALWLAGSSQAPVCNSCHRTHGVSAVTQTGFELASIAACGRCHPEQFKTYQETYHGQVSNLGYTGVAKCSDCHGSHLILPPSDPNSTLAAAHIVDTCRRCHAGANANFAQFMPHADPRQASSPLTLRFSWLFMTLLLIAVFGFFGLHTMLWAIRGYLGGGR